MSIFSATPKPTEADRPELTRLTGIVTQGIAAWQQAGQAIELLQAKQLWRLDSDKTWEGWCERRLGVTARRCLQLSQAAAFGRQLLDEASRIGSGVSGIQLPNTPAALEPLGGVDTQAERAEVWIEASAEAGGVPTREDVKRAISRRKGRPAIPKPRRFRVPGATVAVVFNRRSDGGIVEALEAALKLAQAATDTPLSEAA